MPVFALETLMLTLPSFGFDGGVVFDGSANREAGVGACAAVAESGQALVGWWVLPPGYAVPPSNYAEFQGLRLALRLARDVSATVIRTDSRAIVQAARQMRQGGDLKEQTVGPDWAAISEVTRLLLDLAVPVRWDGQAKDEKKPQVAGVTPISVAAHKLALNACRMTRDKIDPRADDARAWLAHVAANHPSPRTNTIQRAYRRWLNHRGEPCQR